VASPKPPDSTDCCQQTGPKSCIQTGPTSAAPGREPHLTTGNWNTSNLGLRNRHFLVLDVLLLPTAVLISYLIRFEGLQWGAGQTRAALWYLALTLPIKIVTFHQAGLYRRLWSFASVLEVERILKVTTVTGLLSIGIGAVVIPGLGLAPGRVPLSVLLLDALLTTGYVALPRIGARLLASRRSARHEVTERRDASRRALIAGAGASGALIVKELRANPQLGLRPVGFLDDAAAKQGNHLLDLPVLGPLSRLVEIADERRIEELIIAMPGAPGSVIRDLVRAAGAARINTRTMPGMFDIISGRVAFSALRQVQIQDLLRREPVTTDLEAVRRLTAGKTVLVTGAGGSIGSELCRQASLLGPKRIVLLGRGENSIFDILHKLQDQFPNIQFAPVIADIRDRARLARIFKTFEPVSVFHAAAHKHVPMMECNLPEAITNNVLGTRNVVELAAHGRVKQLVFISTDKVVRPTSVMGATKRVAEQIVQMAAEELGRNFMTVRFGNVLGSRGSVVPIFLKQIAAGGPITVTHPEMRRYFMTIPEAVQLVLQAGALGRGGEVFVLDMGEPVKIVDLATDLIRLSGKEIGKDIEIRYSGVRPGEKLYEELFFGAEHAVPTEHPKVLCARNTELPPGVATAISELITAAQEGSPDEELRGMLKRLVPDYDPRNAGTPVPEPEETAATS
jgi:FlaA1/EpsC-like NDP-sugar epimerase